ncbi:hypothetical protein Tco_0036081, partial [Tanacetum coccineum]
MAMVNRLAGYGIHRNFGADVDGHVSNIVCNMGEEIELDKIKESTHMIQEDFSRANAYSEAHSVTTGVPSELLWYPPSNGVMKTNAGGGISSRS